MPKYRIITNTRVDVCNRYWLQEWIDGAWVHVSYHYTVKEAENYLQGNLTYPAESVRYYDSTGKLLQAVRLDAQGNQTDTCPCCGNSPPKQED